MDKQIFLSKLSNAKKNKYFCYIVQIDLRNGQSKVDQARVMGNALEFYNITIKDAENKTVKLSIPFPDNKAFIKSLDNGMKFVQIIQGTDNLFYYVQPRTLNKDELQETQRLQRAINYNAVKIKENAEKDRSFWTRNASTIITYIMLFCVLGICIGLLVQAGKIVEAQTFGTTCNMNVTCSWPNTLPGI
jgi:hypothetical protein